LWLRQPPLQQTSWRNETSRPTDANFGAGVIE
jgi:hypothetical protein